MSQAVFLDTSFIRYFVSVLDYKRYFQIPNESNINLSDQTIINISKETSIKI